MRDRSFPFFLSAVLACWTLTSAVPRAADQIRILVLNMHAGKDAGGKPNLEGIASLVKDQKPDVVLLQEVDRGTNRSGNVDQIGELAKSTKYQSAFGASLFNYDGGEYGLAFLARGLIGYHATIPLPVRPAQTRAGGSHEPRVALVTILQVKKNTWRAINTHLDPADEGARAQEVSALVGAIHRQQAARTPLIVGGDFNSTPDDAVLQPIRSAGLHDAWVECGSGDGFTYPADNPTKRIDYLWLSEGMTCESATVLDTQVSDHRPLLVTLK
jgi:endonuclease/exonuclease/phosphatase family metal-dependent hydrolase